MCNCISKIEDLFLIEVEKIIQNKTGAEIENIPQIQEQNLMSNKTYSNIEWRVKEKGRTKKTKTYIMHKFCPFCGEKYTLTENEKIIENLNKD